MNVITITGTIRRADGNPWPDVPVKLDLATDGLVVESADAAVYLKYLQIKMSDTSGQLPTGEHALTVLAGYRYKITFPDNQTGYFTPPSNSPSNMTVYDIATLFESGTAQQEAAQPANQGFFLQPTTVPEGTTLHVPDGYQFSIFNEFSVDGLLIIDGDFIIA